ncbi:ArsR/SmtB family transcription factor [Sediminibacillus albus]|uniref:Regulatory protein, arsR family n=1 Tax=Sediminibacillus albus TaxID=407036 RepID=A0A1G9ALS4_9BACI|nr:metalloregulator ArsR/SmtB family transcription factor [Sediminibacillus albus]SDK27530.1 regulatory protein, arsR family [Sediminibacillus albus]
MEFVQTSSRKRETYQILIKYSLLWECALGIAAVTNTPLLSSLERTENDWRKLKQSLSGKMLDHLAEVEKNNTWNALLQLLHHKDFQSLSSFLQYIKDLAPEELKSICLPFLGDDLQDRVEAATKGEVYAIGELKAIVKDHSFFPSYIEFICMAESDYIKNHLVEVMSGWYETVIEPDADKLETILSTDYVSKTKMAKKMHPEEFVTWATGGINYLPEPSIHQVLLIPHFTYRPWNVEADLKGTKVFYYPVANQSLDPTDKDMPDNSLILKYKALGDELRLRMIKMLAEGGLSLQEITERLDMGKSTVHHHLKILKSARLISNKGTKYVLNGAILESLPIELSSYLNK